MKANPETKKIAEIIVAQMLETVIPELEERVEVAIMGLEGQINDISLTPGEKGESIIGEKGDVGDKGQDGSNGVNGVDGKDGADGKDGSSGINGRDGKDGDMGEKGKDGQDGVDGSPDEPLEIAEKLNTLEREVDMKVIKGLDKWMNSIKQLVKKKDSGGGGMGNVNNESFSVDSSTTTVTLSDNVASSSSAILVFYQGQMLPRDESYTISGKTIALLFTPQDNTFIDVWYVRT